METPGLVATICQMGLHDQVLERTLQQLSGELLLSVGQTAPPLERRIPARVTGLYKPASSPFRHLDSVLDARSSVHLPNWEGIVDVQGI